MKRTLLMLGLAACAPAPSPDPRDVAIAPAAKAPTPAATPDVDAPNAPADPAPRGPFAATGISPPTGASGTTGPSAATGAPDPTPPADLTIYLTGDPADRTPALGKGALLLMGGGTDVDAAFAFASARTPNGDVVILRASGADGYNPYLYSMIGGFDSVETLMVTTPALADDPYVAWRIGGAELVFVAGGAQDVYLHTWAGTKLAQAVTAAYQRGAIVGGTSAGAMLLGDPVYAAYNGSITSADALKNPFDAALDMDAGPFALMQRTIVDTHFSQRDRLGRLVVFMARSFSTPLWGLGLDEQTALVLEQDGSAQLFGSGTARVLYADHAPAPLVANTPVTYRHLPSRVYSAPASIPTLYDPSTLTAEVDCVDGSLQ
jgi:cyanophycinase